MIGRHTQGYMNMNRELRPGSFIPKSHVTELTITKR